MIRSALASIFCYAGTLFAEVQPTTPVAEQTSSDVNDSASDTSSFYFRSNHTWELTISGSARYSKAKIGGIKDALHLGSKSVGVQVGYYIHQFDGKISLGLNQDKYDFRYPAVAYSGTGPYAQPINYTETSSGTGESKEINIQKYITNSLFLGVNYWTSTGKAGVEDLDVTVISYKLGNQWSWQSFTLEWTWFSQEHVKSFQRGKAKVEFSKYFEANNNLLLPSLQVGYPF